MKNKWLVIGATLLLALFIFWYMRKTKKEKESVLTQEAKQGRSIKIEINK